MSAHTRRALAVAAGILALLGLSATAVMVYRESHGQGRAAKAEYFCPMHPQIVRDKPGECPICGMKLEKQAKAASSAAPSPAAPRRVLFYRHPMNPSVHSQTPAKDEMGMDYVPVYEDETAEHPVAGRATVVVPVDRAALLGIRSEPVGTGSAGGRVRTVGRVAIDETRREVVHAKYDGYVEKLFVDFTGKAVRKGQPLAAIYSPELVAAQQEYLLARRAEGRLAGSAVPGVATGANELAAAARQRLRYWDVSASEIETLERTGEPRRTVTVLRQIGRVLARSGRFASSSWEMVSDPYTVAWRELLEAAVGAGAVERAGEAVAPLEGHFASAQNVRDALLEAAFTGVRVEPLSLAFAHSVEEYVADRALGSSGRLGRHLLGDDAWSRFLAAAESEFRRRFGETVAYERKLLLAVATVD